MSDLILELRNITKRFGAVTANDGIDLTVKRGEILALLGENGAGKSTLMNILAGIYTPDEGEIIFNGEKVQIKNPCDSLSLGIGMVHQHFKLVDTLRAGENILLGHQDLKFWIGRKAVNKRLSEIASRYNLSVQPDKLTSELSAGELQRVEILKLLYRDADLMILDEPTSVLTPQEVQEFFKNLLAMKEDGKTIIFISHKLNEVMQIADRVTILRRGKIVQTLDKNMTDRYEIAKLMVGSGDQDSQLINEVLSPRPDKSTSPTSPSKIKDTVLDVENINFKTAIGEQLLNDVSFKLKEGEILGIAGVSGNGQSQLAFCLTGLLPVSSGSITLKDKNITNLSPKQIASYGVSHVPEDRLGVGTIADFSCYENAILKSFDRRPMQKYGFIDQDKMHSHGQKIFDKYDVRMASPEIAIRFLSGGNIQKLILGREIEESPNLIVAVHPTYGLDFAAVEKIHQIMLEERARGCSIILISEDLDELMRLSDSISVMYKGQMCDVKPTSEWTIEEIGYEMMGLSSDRNISEEEELNIHA